MNSSIFSNGKAGLALGIISVIVLISMGVWWLLQPVWQPVLNSANSPHSRDEIRQRLMEWGVTFKEDESTGNIFVKEPELLSIRSRLSELGIPSEPAPGLEIFSENEYGMSEFTQRVNYRRAIEAEVAETIRSFADINFARVHLTIPKKSIFRDDSVVPKASVTVKPRAGQRLSRGQIQGVVQLVAAAVEDLAPENVVVLDDQGEVISATAADTHTDSQRSRHELEHYYAQKAAALVQGIAQSEDVKVSVSVVYNSDRVKSVRERLLPSGDGGEGYLLKSRRQITENPSEKSSDASSNSVIDEEYAYSTERSEVEHAPGRIEKLSVGIVVMQALSENAVADMKRVVESGLGIDPARGDLLQIVAIPPKNAVPIVVDTPHLPEEAQPRNLELQSQPGDESVWPQITGFYASIAIGAAFVLLVLGWVAASFFGRGKPKTPPRISKQEEQALLIEIKEWVSREPANGGKNA